MDMLINDGLFTFAESHRHKSGKVLYLAFPVVAYKIEVSGKVTEGDPISNAVKRLEAYYKSEEFLSGEEYRQELNKSISQRIAEDLALSADFIDCIREQEKLNQEQFLNDDNITAASTLSQNVREYNQAKVENVYVIYNILSKQYLPWVVPEAEFDMMKREVDNPSEYRISLGDSETKRIFYLKEGKEEYPRGGPTQLELERIMNRWHIPYNTLQYKNTGWGTKFFLMTACFHFSNNPYSYCVTNPFKLTTEQWMEKSVQEWADSNGIYGIDLASELDKIKPKTYYIGDNKNEDEARLEERLNELKTNKSNARIVKELLPCVKELMLSFVRLQHSSRNVSDNYGVGKEADVYKNLFSKQNYLIALYTFFEKAFMTCAKTYYKRENVDRYLQETVNLQMNVDNGEELFRLAGVVGFRMDKADRDALTQLTFSRQQVEYLLKGTNPEGAYSLPVSIYCNLVEAKYDKQHPFNELAMECNNLLTSAIQTRRTRNKAKHGEVYALENTYYDLYHTAIDVFNAVCKILPEEISKFPKAADYGNCTEWENEFESAYKRVKEEMARLNIPDTNNDLIRQLTYEGLSFTMREAEYYAKLSNLYDELLYQLIQEADGLSGEGKIKSELVKILMKKRPGKRWTTNQQKERESVFDCVVAILDGYGIERSEMNDKREYQNGSALRGERPINEVSVRNKLLYYVIVTYENNSKRFGDSNFCKIISKLCNGVSLVERLRGHNNHADFDNKKEEIKVLHDQAYSLCECCCTTLLR